MIKILLSVGVYVSLVLVLGLVLALVTPKESLEQDRGDDEN